MAEIQELALEIYHGNAHLYSTDGEGWQSEVRFTALEDSSKWKVHYYANEGFSSFETIVDSFAECMAICNEQAESYGVELVVEDNSVRKGLQ